MGNETPKPPLPYLSPAEFRIFSLLSKQGPLTIREIGGHLARGDSEFRQGYNTIGTMLQRLIQKGYVERRAKLNMAHEFHPTVPYSLALKWHVDRFLDDFRLVSRADLRVALGIVADRLAAAKG